MALFQKGQSGNPAGYHKGSRHGRATVPGLLRSSGDRGSWRFIPFPPPSRPNDGPPTKGQLFISVCRGRFHGASCFGEVSHGLEVSSHFGHLFRGGKWP